MAGKKDFLNRFYPAKMLLLVDLQGFLAYGFEMT